MAIQIIKKDAIETELRPSGPVGIPLSAPPCLVKTAPRTIPQREHIDTGLWECSPGQFRREIMQGEMMHLLSGHCTFTTEGGETVTLSAGDTAFFPPETRGVWDIKETVRKVYVLV